MRTASPLSRRPALLALAELVLFSFPATLSLGGRGASSLSMKSDIAVVGCGVLGTSLCRQILDSPKFASRTVTGITKTPSRHESIRSTVLESNGDAGSRLDLTTLEKLPADAKFKDVVFCAPPSGFDDYPAAVKDAMTKCWSGPSEGGVFVFTSSGGIYGQGSGETVSESSPTADPDGNPRIAKLVNAERTCLNGGGCVLRLAGLYTLERGAHNYWLESGKDVQGRPDGIVNLLHYDDAASACLAAIEVGPALVSGKVFLISDGNPTTRKGICESAIKAARYAGKQMPNFLGGEDGPLGKVYDGSISGATLKWKPQYASFDEFMSLHS